MLVLDMAGSDVLVGQVVLGPEGWRNAAVGVRDLAGNASTAVVRYVVDRTPPMLVFDSPAEGALVEHARPEVGGRVTDALSGVRSLYPADGPVQWSVSWMGDDVRMAASNEVLDGELCAELIAVDRAGNRARRTRCFVVDANAPVIHLTQPADGSIWTSGELLVAGQVDDVSLVSVVVNGTPVSYEQDGRFQAVIGLPLGPSQIVVEATDGLGRLSTAVRSVVREPEGTTIITFFGAEDQFTYTSNPPTVVGAEIADPVGFEPTGIEVVIDVTWLWNMLPPDSPERAQLYAFFGEDFDGRMYYFRSFERVLRQFAADLADAGIIIDEATIQSILRSERLKWIQGDRVLIPYDPSTEGRFHYCVQVVNLAQAFAEKCIQWVTDLYAPFVEISPVSGQTVIEGPAGALSVRVFDVSRPGIGLGGPSGPHFNPPLSPPGSFVAFLNGVEITHQLVPDAAGLAFTLPNPPLGSENTLHVAASDGVHVTEVRSQFSAVYLSEFLAAEAPHPEDDGALGYIQTWISLLPHRNAYVEIEDFPSAVLRPWLRYAVDLGATSLIPTLAAFVAVTNPADIDVLAQIESARSLAMLNGLRDDIHLDAWLGRRFVMSPSSIQLALIEARQIRKLVSPLPLPVPGDYAPHLAVQYMLSDYLSIPGLIPPEEPEPEPMLFSTFGAMDASESLAARSSSGLADRTRAELAKAAQLDFANREDLDPKAFSELLNRSGAELERAHADTLERLSAAGGAQ